MTDGNHRDTRRRSNPSPRRRCPSIRHCQSGIGYCGRREYRRPAIGTSPGDTNTSHYRLRHRGTSGNNRRYFRLDTARKRTSHCPRTRSFRTGRSKTPGRSRPDYRNVNIPRWQWNMRLSRRKFCRRPLTICSCRDTRIRRHPRCSRTDANIHHYSEHTR